MFKFKPGMIVECIDDTASYGKLKAGSYYEIYSVNFEYNQINLVGINGNFCKSRFIPKRSTLSKLETTPVHNFVYIPEGPIPFDIDNTLILPIDAKVKGGTNVVRFTDPYNGEDVFRYRHIPNIKLLINYKARGYFTLVWSKNGGLWAKTVIEALGLAKHCSIISGKPPVYVDDKECSLWMGPREWLDPLDDFGQEPTL